MPGNGQGDKRLVPAIHRSYMVQKGTYIGDDLQNGGIRRLYLPATERRRLWGGIQDDHDVLFAPFLPVTLLETELSCMVGSFQIWSAFREKLARSFAALRTYR